MAILVSPTPRRLAIRFSQHLCDSILSAEAAATTSEPEPDTPPSLAPPIVRMRQELDSAAERNRLLDLDLERITVSLQAAVRTSEVASLV